VRKEIHCRRRRGEEQRRRGGKGRFSLFVSSLFLISEFLHSNPSINPYNGVRREIHRCRRRGEEQRRRGGKGRSVALRMREAMDFDHMPHVLRG